MSKQIAPSVSAIPQSPDQKCPKMLIATGDIGQERLWLLWPFGWNLYYRQSLEVQVDMAAKFWEERER